MKGGTGLPVVSGHLAKVALGISLLSPFACVQLGVNQLHYPGGITCLNLDRNIVKPPAASFPMKALSKVSQDPGPSYFMFVKYPHRYRCEVCM